MSWISGAGAFRLTGMMKETQEAAEAAELIREDLEQLNPNAIMRTLEGWVPGLIQFAWNLAVAVLILFIGTRIAKLFRRFLHKTFERMGIDLGVSKFLTTVANAGVYVLTIFIAADKIGIPSASIIALLGSAGLAIGLSLQGSLANVAGGILILLMRPFAVNDYIVHGGVEGTVQNIGLVYTTLLSADNKKITIPNGTISNGTVINVTAQEKRRVDIEVGIGYSSDMKQAKAIMERLYESDPRILTDDGITVYVGALGDSSVVIGVRGWTKTEDYWAVRWAMLERIKEEFDREGIEIPFNQLDVNVKQG